MIDYSSADLFAAFMMLALLFSNMNRRRDDKTVRALNWLLACHFVLLVTDGCTFLLYRYPASSYAIVVLYVFVYTLVMLDITAFTKFLIENIKLGGEIRFEKAIMCAVCTFSAVSALLYAVAAYYSVSGEDIIFAVFDQSYYAFRMFWTKLIPMLLALENIVLIFCHRRELRVKETVFWMSFVLIPALIETTVTIRVFRGERNTNSPFLLSIALMLFIMFIKYGIEKDIKLSQQKAALARIDAKLAESRNEIMLSQIQPHFLYNTLSTVSYLCKTDPQKAYEASVSFTEYLRSNFESINCRECIAFSKELEHTDQYLSLEKMRFGDRLRVEYDIRCDSFRIPSLTLQPIAENAVKHGICTRKEGGTVKISSFETGNSFVVGIEDNGVGFEEGTYDEAGSRSHVGIANVSERLSMMCGGRLEIHSAVGEGTKVFLYIPKEDEI